MIHHQRFPIGISDLGCFIRIVLPIPEPLPECPGTYLCPLLFIQVGCLSVRSFHVTAFRLTAGYDCLLLGCEKIFGYLFHPMKE